MNKVYTYMSRCDCSIRVIIEAEQSSLNTCRRHVITSVNMTNRQDMLEKARLAEQAERYEDMTEYMEKLVEIVGTTTNQHLNTEERNLLSVAFKNVVGSRRSSWRVISSIEQKLERSGDETKKRLTGEYRKSVEDEIQSACNKVLNLLDKHLLTKDVTKGSDIDEVQFYEKMKSDFYRYLAEVGVTPQREEHQRKSTEAQERAFELVSTSFPPTHPTRLGLALSYSVFYYEIQNDPEKACSLAKKAFDDAIAELDQLKEDSYKDSTLIMQLLRDNLTLWTADPHTHTQYSD